MAIPKDQLEKLIEALIGVKNNKKASIYNQKDLHEIATDVGFSETDWQEYQAEIKNQITAGQTFLSHQNTEDAIRHLSQATRLNPYSLEAHAALAQAYKQQYMHTRSHTDRERAIVEARICLELDNRYTPAYQLISDLKRHANASSINKRPMALIAISIVVGLLVLFYILFFSKQNAPPTTEPINADEPAKTEEVVAVVEEKNNLGVPVVFPKHNHLVFEAQTSDLNDYSTSYSYRFEGYITPKDILVEELKIKIDLLDKTGKILVSDVKTPVYPSKITYRPNDLIPVSYLRYTQNTKAPKVHRVSISIVHMNHENAISNYEPSKPIPLTWATERPANYNVKIAQRKLSKTPASNNMEYQALILEAENTGNMSIKQLKVEIVWKKHNDETIVSKTAYFTSTSDPKIKRGHTRLFAGTYLIPEKAEKIKGYEIMVTNVE